MTHWNFLALSLWLLAPHFQNNCSPLTFINAPHYTPMKVLVCVCILVMAKLRVLSSLWQIWV